MTAHKIFHTFEMVYPFIAISACVYLLASIFYFGKRLPAYNHTKNTISELGEVNSIFEKPVGFWVFLPIGLVLILPYSTVS